MVAIWRIESEKERLLAQRRHEERRQRMTGYRDFLAAIYRLDAMAWLAPVSRESLERWLETYRQLYVGIGLIAPELVRIRAADVNAAVDAIAMQAIRLDASEPFEHRFARAYRDQRGRLILALEGLLDRMWSELGSHPDQQPQASE